MITGCKEIEGLGATLYCFQTKLSKSQIKYSMHYRGSLRAQSANSITKGAPNGNAKKDANILQALVIYRLVSQRKLSLFSGAGSDQEPAKQLLFFFFLKQLFKDI